MAQANSLPPRPGGLPASFNPPANLPSNINFNAPVIRMGMGSGSKSGGISTPTDRAAGGADSMGNRGRMGLGAGVEQQRAQIRESMVALAPPTREEIMRTIFVGNVPDGVGGDLGMERILQASSGGKLRRWTRATDADGKNCKFGFAEFEDAEGLETVAETLKDGLEVPLNKVEPKKSEANGDTKMEEEKDDEVKTTRLLVRSMSTSTLLVTMSNSITGRRRRSIRQICRRVARTPR